MKSTSAVLVLFIDSELRTNAVCRTLNVQAHLDKDMIKDFAKFPPHPTPAKNDRSRQ